MLRLDECKSYHELKCAREMQRRAKLALIATKKRVNSAYDKVKEERKASVKGPIVDNPSHKSPQRP